MLENSVLNDLKFDPVYIVVGMGAALVVLLILLVIAFVKISNLKKKYNKFMMGDEPKSLEELIQKEASDIHKLQEEDEKNKKAMQSMNQVISGCYQKTGIVKYDALTGMGGQISFALALLDLNNTGIMVNSIHTREGSYLYMKEITEGKCSVQLGKEEEKALEIAVNSKNQA